MIALLSALSWIKRAALANPMIALCFILAAWAAVERHQAHKWQSRAEQCQQASQAAAAATKALRAREASQSKETAREADQKHDASRAVVRDATAAFIARRRVQPSGISTAAAVDQADDPAVPESVPPGVVVDQADVQTCGDLYAYSVAAYEWARAVGQ